MVSFDVECLSHQNQSKHIVQEVKLPIAANATYSNSIQNQAISKPLPNNYSKASRVIWCRNTP